MNKLQKILTTGAMIAGMALPGAKGLEAQTADTSGTKTDTTKTEQFEENDLIEKYGLVEEYNLN